MNLFGGYQGKRVKKDQFKLWKQKEGKRVSKKPNNFLNQIIPFISGKIKYVSSKLIQAYDNHYSEEVRLDNLSNQKQNLPLENSCIPSKGGNLGIVNIVIHTLLDVEKVLSSVNAGYVTIANYETLKEEQRRKFDSELTLQLLRIGTHLTHISKSEIICAKREIAIEDNISSKPKKNSDSVYYNSNIDDFSSSAKSKTTSLMDVYFDFKSSNLAIINLPIYSLLDVEKVLFYVEEGYVVLANYSILTQKARSEFDKRLAIELMRIGTHLTHVSKSEIICAKREIAIGDNISLKKAGKIYELNFTKR